MTDPVVEHGRCEIRARLERFMELSRREQELIEQITVSARELAQVRREVAAQARSTAEDAAALLSFVERRERPGDLLTN